MYSELPWIGLTALALTVASPAIAQAPDPSKITIGNGERNNIQLEGARRVSEAFMFPRVEIDKPGFLVMHPFRDGKPVRNEYVGAVPVPAGVSENVIIRVGDDPQTGDMYIVMLHYDVNEDLIFDFGDGKTVPDKPVFEGNRMIALRYQAP